MKLFTKRISAFFFLFFITSTFFSVYSAAKKPQVEIKTISQAIHVQLPYISLDIIREVVRVQSILLNAEHEYPGLTDEG